MGALGPRRVVLRPDGFLPPAPYHIEDNRYTLLDSSDLVLVDAIGTGFSRAADAELSKKYWGLKGDIDSFSEFIRLYITRNERWNSPLFLFGESYGTTRAAGVAGNLAGQGISFNGITLLSMALTFQTLVDNRSNDEPYVLLIPSFASAAWFHKKLPADLMADADKARQEAARWAVTDYAQALAKGDSLSAEERQKTIDQMSRYTGLSKDVIDQANLRIDVAKFTHYLLLDQKLRVGRLDGRFTGPDPDGVLDTAFYDPTEASILPPFTSVYNQYVRAELGYQTDLPYHTFISDPQFEEKWEWGQGINGFPDTATALRQAMVKNSYLKIMVMEGFYDLATPYFAADYTVDHLNLGSAYQKNISKATYEAGHMVYLPTDELKKMKGDEAQFITRSLQQ
jgi:carboxypeptidase C (cathepsin A)